MRDDVYDLLNYQTTGKEIERVYLSLIDRINDKISKENIYFSTLKDGKGIEVGTVDSLMKEIYPSNKIPESSSDFYPLHFLRQLKIVSIHDSSEGKVILFNKESLLRTYSEYGMYLDIPLSCIILEQLRKLPEGNVNKWYYYIIRKIIYENRLKRLGGNKEVDLIKKPPPHIDAKRWNPNINQVKYGFFSNVVDYFYFEKNSYVFNQRFIRDLLRYVLHSRSNYSAKYQESLEKFFDIIKKQLINITTYNGLIFQGLLVGLMRYNRYCELSKIQRNDLDIIVKLDKKSDIGFVYDFDADNTTYDFIQIKSTKLIL